MIGAFVAQDPSVGIFWVVETGPGEVRLLTAGCSLDAAEPYGDFLTFAGGHHAIWASWRKIKDPNAALRALVRTFEYEEWPRGRIVFDQQKKLFHPLRGPEVDAAGDDLSDSSAVRSSAG